jgi:hypothetical protein
MRRASPRADPTGIWVPDPPKVRNLAGDLKSGELSMQPSAQNLNRKDACNLLGG